MRRSRRADDEVDADAALREALSQESAEVLRHQLAVERHAAAKMRSPDMMVSFFLAGIGTGIGWAGASGWLRKRSSRGKRRRS